MINLFGNIVSILNIDDDLIDITRKTGKINFLRGTNKKYINNPNKMKITRKVNDTAPVFSFQLCSCKFDNKT